MSPSNKLFLSASLAALLALPAAAAPTEEARATFRAPTVVIDASALPKPACAPAKPIAPDQARVMDITGTVLVEYTVYADGRVGEISLAKSSAHPALEQAVKGWLDGCAFTPLVARGHAISVRVIQPYVFKRA